MQRRRTLMKVATLGVIAAVALSGCTNGPKPGTNSTEPAANSKQPLNLFLVDSPTMQDLKATYIPQFEKQTGIKVNVDIVPESGMDAKLSVSLGSGSNRYDVIETGAKNLSTIVAAKWIKPLDGYLKDSSQTPKDYTSGFPQQLLKNLQENGHTYTMPYQLGVDLLFYNKAMFKAAGLDANNPPRTMTQIVAAAKKLAEPSKGQAGFVARGTRASNDNSFSWIMMWLLNGGRWADSNGKAKYVDILTAPPAVTTTEQYKELMTTYGAPGASNFSFLEAQTQMQQAKAAMWLDAAQLGPSLEDPTASKIAGDVGYAVPEGIKGAGSNYIVGSIWGFSMVRTTKKEKEAWQLIQFLTGKKVAIGQALSGANGTPGWSNALLDPAVEKKFNPEYLKAVAQAEEHVNPLYSPIIPQGTQIRGILSLALSQILSGQASTTSAMTDANEQIKTLMSQ